MDLTNDFWTGLIVGAFFGILVGIAWEDSLELLLRSYYVYKERRKNDEK